MDELPQKWAMPILRTTLPFLKRRRQPTPRGAPGARAYAIGDIHGRLDLLEEMLSQIEAEIVASGAKETYLVFLGDLIDRGPDSAGVVERLRTYRPEGVKLVFVMGNHEEIFLKLLNGETKLLRQWLRYGGAECLRSYGLAPETLWTLDNRRALALIEDHVPKAHREFLSGMADMFQFGDYLFVHAGIRPGVALPDQTSLDLRWIREPFLNSKKKHDLVIVHGHTIMPVVEERHNRIGIDTGAYLTGRLTALVVQDDQRRYLATRAERDGEGPA